MIKNEVCQVFFLSRQQIRKRKSTSENATDRLHGSSSSRAPD
jgi:hypothetical protein